MKIVDLRTNHLENPLGYQVSPLVFTWIVECDGKTQEAARVEIAADKDFKTILFDSGFCADLMGTGYTPAFTPAERARYYWRVSASADNGEKGVSESAWFETALGEGGENFKAVFISPSDRDIHPVFQKSFSISAEIVSARAYACGLGIYELEINGQKAGDEYLLPGFHAYDFWLQYQTFDVTSLLKNGDNVLSAFVGNGWYKGRFGFTDDGGRRYGDTLSFLCQLEVTLADGQKVLLCTDESWKCRPGNTLDSNIYDGETQDGTMEIPGLSIFSGEKDWKNAIKSVVSLETLTPRMSPPITYQESFEPKEVIHTPAGETVFDFGQEITGWVVFQNRAPKGSTLVLRFGEILQQDNFFQDNLRSAKATFTYISSGKEEPVRPRFTFFGFRYMCLEGFENPDPKDFRAYVIHSKLDRIGTIETSDERVNRLFLNALWGQKGNFLDVPTDCPQRDERMGWTGDAQAFCSTACFNLASSAFYGKYMRDMELEQRAQGGSVPVVVPVIKKDGVPLLGSDSCAWADAATIVPWTVYLHSGDKAQLEREYPSMKMWADRIRRYDEEDGGKRLWQVGFHFADWLALDNYKEPKSCIGGTDSYYIASAYYAYSVQLTAKAAKVLGKEEDQIYYENLAQEVREAFVKEYFTPNGRCAADTQTGYVVALYMDLVPEEMRPRLVKELRRKLKENKMRLTTGFVGTPYLCQVLSRYGASEDAYELLLNEECPGWLYEVKMGATTVWERWNSVLPDGNLSDLTMNSLNHYAYGSIVEWMYRYMCGLNPCEHAPGFAEVDLTPRPGEGLRFAKASLRTASGLYESGWERGEDGSVSYSFTIPFNCKAKLSLPESAQAVVDGKPVLAGQEVILLAGRHTAVTK